MPPDLDESLATLREQQNYSKIHINCYLLDFDPHNYQSYYNNIQIVGDQNFASDYKNIYKDKGNFNILKGILLKINFHISQLILLLQL